MKTTLRLLTFALTLATALPAVADQFSTNLLLPPGAFIDADNDGIITYPSTDVVIGKLRLELPTNSVAPPVSGTQTHDFGLTVRMDFFRGAGFPTLHVSVPAQATMRATIAGAVALAVDVEMLKLDISGGDLPAGVMIRESPTLASTGKAVLLGSGNGTFEINGFFDIFTELSLDGGATWVAAGAALRGVWKAPANEVTAATPNLPPAAFKICENESPFPNGVTLRNLRLGNAAQSFAPPAAGASQTNQTTITFGGQLSLDGGTTFSQFSTRATLTQKVTNYLTSGSTQFFDTEITQLDIVGGSLPSPLMLRESPTKASTGRASVHNFNGTFRIASFFDVFVELSIDGGANWLPMLTGACVFAPPNTTPTVLFAAGDKFPTAGDVGSIIPADAVFAKVGPPTIGPTGAVAFFSKWTSKTGGSTGALRRSGSSVVGIVDGSPRLVVSAGDTVGSSPLGVRGIFAGDGDVTIDPCSTAFTLVGTLTGGAGGFSSKHTGIVQFAFADNSSKILAEVGQSAGPDLPDAQLKSISSVAHLSGRRVLFVSKLTGRGINPKNDRALCATDSAGILHVVMQQGVTPITVSFGVSNPGETLTVKEFAVLQIVPHSAGRTSSFNGSGEVVSKVTFEGLEEPVIVHTNLP